MLAAEFFLYGNVGTSTAVYLFTLIFFNQNITFKNDLVYHQALIAMGKKTTKNYLTKVKVLIRCDFKGCGSTAMQSVNTENREHLSLSKSDNCH